MVSDRQADRKSDIEVCAPPKNPSLFRKIFQPHPYDDWMQIRPQSIVWFISAACPNLELKHPTFLGWKNEASTTADMRG